MSKPYATPVLQLSDAERDTIDGLVERMRGHRRQLARLAITRGASDLDRVASYLDHIDLTIHHPHRFGSVPLTPDEHQALLAIHERVGSTISNAIVCAMLAAAERPAWLLE